MEPFRPLIDRKVFELNDDNFKDELISYLSINIEIANQKQTLVNAIQIYASSVFKALNSNDVSQIKFFRMNE